MTRFLRLFRAFREAERTAEYERERARKLEMRSVEQERMIREAEDRAAAAESLIESVRSDRDCWRAECRRWQDKAETAAEEHLKDLRQEVDWRAYTATRLTVHGSAPPIPEPAPRTLPNLNQGLRRHPREVIREKQAEFAKQIAHFNGDAQATDAAALNEFFAQEQKAFSARQKSGTEQ